MPKIRTLIASPHQPYTNFAEGLHDPDLVRTHMFFDFVTRRGQLRNTLTLGRDKSCDIWIRDKFASRQHLKLERRGDGAILVSDMESTNGILVEGKPIVEPVVLRLGMRLRIGDSYLYAVDEDGRFPIKARTVDELMRIAAKVYGNNALAAKRLGVSRETVRRRVLAPLGVSA